MNNYIIKTNGDIVPIIPENNKEFSLEEMQKMVGGLIELFDVPNSNITLVGNDEAKLMNMPINLLATFFFGNMLFSGDYFAGDIAVIENKYIK